MERQEIKTIAEALVTKQSWLRKEFQYFLNVWKKITEIEISNKKFQYFLLGKDDSLERNVYLERGYADLYYNQDHEPWLRSGAGKGGGKKKFG